MIIDWLVLGSYLLGITVLGLVASTRVKSSTSFFISNRNFGKTMLTLFTFGTGTNSDQAVTAAAKTYVSGAAGVWYQWLNLFVTPFYWILGPLFRRMRAVTTADYLTVRYDRSVALLFVLVGILQLSVNIGVVLKASSAMIFAVTDGAISPTVSILAITILFLIYGIAGGLSAAIITDFVQGLLTIVLSFLILPFALDLVGGMNGLRSEIDNPDVFSLVAPGEITVFYIVVISINALVGWVASPYSMSMCGAGKSEEDSRIGLVAGMFLKRICTIAWVLTGLVGIALYANTAIEPDHVYGALARDILPSIAPGLVGLFIASLLAAVMSSCDTFMVSAAALFTENVYRPYIEPNRSEKHYVMVGRLASAAVVAAGIVIAFELSSVVAGLELFWKVQAMMGVAIWASFVWRRATVAGVWSSTLIGYFVWLFTSDVAVIGWSFNDRFAHLLPEILLYEARLSLPWQMLIYLSASTITMIVVSYWTVPPPKKTLDRVYSVLRTPVRPGEPEGMPVTLPPGMSPSPRRPLLQHPDFEIMCPTRFTAIGFVLCWGIVGAMIAWFSWFLG